MLETDVDEQGEARELHVRATPYKVRVSGSFILLSVFASAFAAYTFGRAARLFFMEGAKGKFVKQLKKQPVRVLRDQLVGWNPYVETAIPFLVTADGEAVPQNHFDAVRSISFSSWHSTSDNSQYTEACRNQNDEKACPTQDSPPRDEEEDEDEPEPGTPGVHLMVDLKNVDSTFLNSEQRLVGAMRAFVEEGDLKLRSYHCFSFHPTGFACIGALMQNYIAIHTWPDKGVLTFDLFTAKSFAILPLLSSVKRLFSIPGEHVDQPVARWTLKIRGYWYDDTKVSNVLLSTDLGSYVSFGYSIKNEVASVETKFQQIDIYDLIERSSEDVAGYERSLSNDGSYESQHPFLFRPNRLLFLDGWAQSSLHYEAAYHEALVHPALFAHPSPKRVAIIGGGEGATLREVLKHNTVEKAIMIEIDEDMVNVSREYIPEWSDCGNLVGSSPWCINDPRANVYYEDALAWFMQRYEHDKRPEESIDVIILDALDPESEIPFAKELYSNVKFMRAFYNSLSDDGILVMQLGQAPDYHSPDATYSRYKNRAATTRLLEVLGFESIHTYEEANCGFGAPWTYVVGFKAYNTRTRWYANAAEIDLEVTKRSVSTKTGKSPFLYFDGPTMVSYQVPHRAVEAVFCRKTPTPNECFEYEYRLDPSLPNIPASSFEVKMSGVGTGAGLGLFTKVDIPKGARLTAETGIHAVTFMPSTVALIEGLQENEYAYESSILQYYMEGYGFTSQFYGKPEVSVDSGLLTFANHGCNGTYNVGKRTLADEFTANVNVVPEQVNGRTIFNPVVDRHFRLDLVQSKSIRDISTGEEILENYLDLQDSNDWARAVEYLRELCAGKTIGVVSEYEEEATHDE